jgi:Asp-tRNA(Asn)/Glu-tRNA(Gln) amidotransferase C subunit
MISKDELVNNARAKHLRMVMDENKKFRLQLKAVRDLAEQYSKENLVSPYPEMAQQILAAIDSVQDG